MAKMIDETNKRYGMVTVISRGPNDKNGKAQWWCVCDCGNKFLSRGSDLRRNKVLTCGCTSYKKGMELVGKKYGKLTVIEFLGTNDYGKHLYKCKCDCGNIVNVVGAHLKTGNTNSCGCIRLEDSIGEQNIVKILNEHKLNYKKEYSFNDLKYKQHLRFDFAILNEENKVVRLIEFDGKQHTQKDNYWYTPDIEIKDNLKNQYAKDHNIPLVRIPYIKRDTMTIEDIFGSKYELQ